MIQSDASVIGYHQTVVTTSVARNKLQLLRSEKLAKRPWLVHAFSTRVGGVSRAYGGSAFNLGFTKQDSRAAVERNRELFLRELGVANFASGLVALLSLWNTSFLLPSAIYAAIFYGVASVVHVTARDRSRNENIAMVSDLFIAVVLANYVAWMFWS